MAKSMPELKFVWYGRAPTIFTPKASELKREIRNKPQNVILTGVMNDMVGAHNAGDILLFPSINESFGLCVIEAAACGKPVLLRSESSSEMFGFTIKYGTVKNCIKKIEMLLNKKYYSSYVKNSMKEIKSFDIREHVEGLVKIYENVLG